MTRRDRTIGAITATQCTLQHSLPPSLHAVSPLPIVSARLKEADLPASCWIRDDPMAHEAMTYTDRHQIARTSDTPDQAVERGMRSLARSRDSSPDSWSIEQCPIDLVATSARLRVAHSGHTEVKAGRGERTRPPQPILRRRPLHHIHLTITCPPSTRSKLRRVRRAFLTALQL